MLCYAFNRELLTERDISSVGTESFDNIYNLFSIILAMMIRKQIKKGINKECFQNLSQLPMKGHYKVIAEQNFDIMNRKKERGKKMNHYNFDKSFSINHSYISDINSSELTKLKRNLINKTKY